MGAKLDLRGQKFGRLTVLEEVGRAGGGVLWKCQCDCGNIVNVRSNHLRRGAQVSCGCYNQEVIKTHGKSKTTKVYHVWQCMKDRCLNPNAQEAERYIGRGIKVCDEWLDFENFYEWAMANGYKRGLSLDRIDNDGNYEPSNCRWATAKQQCRNRSNNAIVEYLGEKRCLSEWAEITHQPYARLASRYRRGWPDREIILGRA